MKKLDHRWCYYTVEYHEGSPESADYVAASDGLSYELAVKVLVTFLRTTTGSSAVRFRYYETSASNLHYHFASKVGNGVFVLGWVEL